MPHWLINQLKEAYRTRDLYKVRTLNACWFYYQRL
ncbi:cortex morphogenetic protein CmpA [Paenalkalicoccus suaedae]|uniref:Cortex morphogenetic protein CmpA n=1 Tax=Paenalkalicoccus suaedae TaxID=2592382 RepID=A0A859FB62_9BACI|nr:cortex morphogenetic protein CmpA [Paenalkalicoccus suaedae]QKS70200.1 cortex morphogenetic protein CmpA [Paenalkalicoccus suaedae]